ncbi:nuclear transport factor 2 family protein [Streptacidiphilus cavernicola]|uniref:Nuclear transport factor 2 family protein n=1 Tax=Streptacidiphilus cavernicola TaxID=3342716 RepID=A0ABV6VP91_9ACTN
MDSAHPNAALLRTLYADLTRIAEYAADDIVYHPAERDTPEGAPDLHGKAAVTAKEQALARATEGTLRADIESVVANDHFGAVLGVFHARPGDQVIAMPFCGLWRFRDGRVTDHWQNAYDPSAMVRALTRATATRS